MARTVATEPGTARAQMAVAGAARNELSRLDATELAALIAQRKVSPVEVVDAALVRLDETEAALRAFVAVDEDNARRAARAAEAVVMRGDAFGQGPHRRRRSASELWLVDHER
jgi:hypothetical protein